MLVHIPSVGFDASVSCRCVMSSVVICLDVSVLSQLEFLPVYRLEKQRHSEPSVTLCPVWFILFLEWPSLSVISSNRDANNTQINHLHHLWVHMCFQELFVFPPTAR